MSEATLVALYALGGIGVVWLIAHSWAGAVRWVRVQGQQRQLPRGRQQFWATLTQITGPLGRLIFMLVHNDDATAGSDGNQDTRRENPDLTGAPHDAAELTVAPISDYCLHVVTSRRAPQLIGKQFALVDGVNAVGRQPTSEPGVTLVPIAGDDGISKNHLYIEGSVGGGLSVTDRASRFGTWHNQDRLPPYARTPLQAGDTLRLGNTTFELRLGGMASAARSAGGAPLRIEILPNWQLRVQSGPDRGKRLPIAGRRQLIGRASEADWRLTGNQVSRQHAEVWQEGSIVRIRDLNSKYGLLVNRHRHQDRALETGDIIQIGENEIVFEANGEQ